LTAEGDHRAGKKPMGCPPVPVEQHFSVPRADINPDAPRHLIA
jgi:hypothetical protein